MTLRLIREPSAASTTIGVLFVDDRFFAFTLEDELRERPGQPVLTWKVAGQTAIPAGRYRVVVSYSPRFGRPLPELLDVPGFTGIRLHPGNRHTDTEGCVLVGFRRSGVVLEDSLAACARLQAAIDGARRRGESVWLVIENPLSYGQAA